MFASENFEINECEVKISQSIHTVFHSKYGITKVKILDLIFDRYFFWSYPLKNDTPDNIKNIGTAYRVIEREKKKENLWLNKEIKLSFKTVGAKYECINKTRMLNIKDTNSFFFQKNVSSWLLIFTWFTSKFWWIHYSIQAR